MDEGLEHDARDEAARAEDARAGVGGSGSGRPPTKDEVHIANTRGTAYLFDQLHHQGIHPVINAGVRGLYVILGLGTPRMSY